MTPRLQTLTYPVSTGQTTSYSYFDNSHDRRLQTLQNLGSGSANISKFDYAYDAEGQIQIWTKQINAEAAVAGTYSYDLSDQLTSATNATIPEAQEVMPSTPHLLANYSYGYDAGSNRSSDETGAHTYNAVNQTQDTGFSYYNGNLTTDGAYNYSWDGLNRLTVIEQIIPGLNFAPIRPSPTPTPTPKGKSTASSGSGSVSPLVRPTPPPTMVTYTHSEFTYDGLGRRVRIIEKQDTRQQSNTSPPNWVTVSDHRYVWSGNTIAEERDSTGGTVTKRFFPEGEQIGGVSYYFTRDHLGSVREMTSSTGTIIARYEYDPYGNAVNIMGGTNSDFGYTGHWYHKPGTSVGDVLGATRKGHNLTLFRAYDPSLGRWISRDPVGEAAGPNLYEYAENNPDVRIDPLGLQTATGVLDALGKLLGGLAKLDASAAGTREIEKALNDCRKVPHSPGFKCKCCVLSIVISYSGGDTLLANSGTGIVYEKPCSEVEKQRRENLVPAGSELHEAFLDW